MIWITFTKAYESALWLWFLIFYNNWSTLLCILFVETFVYFRFVSYTVFTAISIFYTNYGNAFFLLMASIRIPNTKYETSSSCISSSLFISYFVHLLILSTKYTLHYALSVFSFSLQQRRSFYRLVSFFKLRKQTLRVLFSFLCANIFICLYCDQKTCI